MKQENHTIETSSESLLKSLVGQQFVDYRSDMEMAERAFETVCLCFQNCRIKIKIEEICSPVEWIREGSKTSLSAVTSESRFKGTDPAA